MSDAHNVSGSDTASTTQGDAQLNQVSSFDLGSLNGNTGQAAQPAPTYRLVERKVIDPKIRWDGTRDGFMSAQRRLMNHLSQVHMDYLLAPEFLALYQRDGYGFITRYPAWCAEQLIPPLAQVRQDNKTLYGMLGSVFNLSDATAFFHEGSRLDGISIPSS